MSTQRQTGKAGKSGSTQRQLANGPNKQHMTGIVLAGPVSHRQSWENGAITYFQQDLCHRPEESYQS